MESFFYTHFRTKESTYLIQLKVNILINDETKFYTDLIIKDKTEINVPTLDAHVVHACGGKFLFVNSLPGVFFMTYFSWATNICYVIQLAYYLNKQKSTWELCCSFGLKMLTLQTKAKYDCLVQAGMSELNKS